MSLQWATMSEESSPRQILCEFIVKHEYQPLLTNESEI